MTTCEDTTARLHITQIKDPAGYYASHAGELAVVGADAFGQPVEDFAPQVAERFDKAGLAQILSYGKQIVGFALYDMLQGHHWRLTFNRG